MKVRILTCALLYMGFISYIADSFTLEGSNNLDKQVQFNEPEKLAHWISLAQEEMNRRIEHRAIEKQAKQLILFIGDGMGLSTLTASRIFKGQDDGLMFGEEAQLYMERFPFVDTSKTYCANWQVADSACSSTAYSCGVKANTKTMGVSPTVTHKNCTLQNDETNHVSSILSWAQANDMSTGIVTTTSLTEASPGGFYAHIASREWENDADIVADGEDPAICHDIAKQLFENEPVTKINVILGGGRQHFLNNETSDPENPSDMGKRLDGKNYPTIWLENKQNQSLRAKYATLREELSAIDVSETDYLLGLFSYNHLEFKDMQDEYQDPSLAEMTEVAIKILSKNPKGFFLFVEGGRIDSAHHSNYARRALVETIEFDKAIQLADELTVDDETLIVVSSDHSHLLTIAGDPDRGNSILGLSGNMDHSDGLPATTLAYINGPGYREYEWDDALGKCVRPNISNDDTSKNDYQYLALYPRSSATHAGEDVLIFGKGPFAHLFTGVNEQSFIPHAMSYAGCINPYGMNFCEVDKNSSSNYLLSYYYSFVILVNLFLTIIY